MEAFEKVMPDYQHPGCCQRQSDLCSGLLLPFATMAKVDWANGG